MDQLPIRPQLIETIAEKSTYLVPLFKVMDEGLVQDGAFELRFCKGDKADPMKPRQKGFFTETLIAAAKKYLEENNVGPLATRDTSMAITKLDEALLWIGKRAADRQARGVQGTHKQ